ncbi:MAG: hypothetical protein EOO06_15185 [Chitinophagaceae bacterium]|nr:MAG: hypothetical protein EOO06_15185 [Chitinophagaceae bacterium]
MYYIYVLYSESSDKYYVGYTTDITSRLRRHNEQEHFNTYTCKSRPWRVAALFWCGEDAGAAKRIECFIKRQKSRELLKRLCDLAFVPSGILAQLVRVPHVRSRTSGKRVAPIQSGQGERRRKGSAVMLVLFSFKYVLQPSFNHFFSFPFLILLHEVAAGILISFFCSP